jgi:tRNA threonylcarbamoyladenosine biosynthesis protein TsaE
MTGCSHSIHGVCYNIGMREQRQRAAQQPQAFECVSHSPTQTARIGQRLGELFQRGDIVLLLGEFGAGKTHFAKGVAEGLGSTDLVNSPSFVLINQYKAGASHQSMPIYHIDLYRLEDAREIAGIGLEEIANGDGVCIIEWGERAVPWLPPERITVQLGYLSETKRSIHFQPHGERATALIAALKRVVLG